jgi:hypothetical protein
MNRIKAAATDSRSPVAAWATAYFIFLTYSSGDIPKCFLKHRE